VRSEASESQERTHLHDLLGKVGELGDVDTEALVAHAGQDLVQERDVATGERVGVGLDVRLDVQVLDVRDLVRERRELVEVGREEDRGARDGREVSVRRQEGRGGRESGPSLGDEAGGGAGGEGDALRDGPREAEAVVRRRAAPELVDDDEAIARRLAQDGARLEHLGHEGRHALELRVAGADAAQDRVEDGHLGARAGHKGADLGEERDEGRLADEDRLAAGVRTRDDAELARVALEVDVVGDKVDALLHLEARVARLVELEAAGAALEDGRLDVRDRRDEGRVGEAAGRTGPSA